MSNMLIDEQPLLFSPTLAKELGSIEAAVFMQQLHFWLGISQHRHSGKTWVYNTMDQCVEMVRGTIKKRTLERIISSLKERNLIFVEKLRSDKWDKTNYYSINYVELNKIGRTYRSNADTAHPAKMAESIPPKWRIPYRQNGSFDIAKVADCLQKITTEDYFRILNAILKKSKTADKTKKAADDFEIFWEAVPNKDGKKPAQAAFKKAIKKISLEDLIIAYKANVQVCESQNRFKKNPATWLNQECWNDESIQSAIKQLKNHQSTQNHDQPATPAFKGVVKKFKGMNHD